MDLRHQKNSAQYIFQFFGILFCCFLSKGFAQDATSQVPRGINYQAIVRDGAGVPITNGSNVTIAFIITNANSDEYTETTTTTVSNDFGLVNLVIGTYGDPTEFAEFDWSATPCNLEITVGGVSIGSQELASVPYSFYSAIADSVAGVDLSNLGTPLWTESVTDLYRETGNVGIGTTTPDYTLDVAGDIGVNDYIRHNDDNTTYMRMLVSQLLLRADAANFSMRSDAFYADYSGVTYNIIANTKLIQSTKDVLTLTHVTEDFSNPNPGQGSGILFQGIDTGKEIEDIARIAGVFEKSADAAEYGYLSFQTRENGGVLKETMKLGYSGDLTLPNLSGSGNGNVGVDANGTLVRLGTVSTGDLWTLSGANIYRATGNVGIGSTTTNYKLDVRAASDVFVNTSSSGAPIGTLAGVRLAMSSGAIGTQYYIAAEKTDNTAGGTASDLIMRKDFSTAGGVLKFFRYDNSTNNVIINDSKTTASAFGDFIVANGNVGIGVASPSHKLDVNGDINTSGEIHRTATGNANMVPIAYGFIDTDGTVVTSSGNISAVYNSTGKNYSITITGESYFYSSYITIVTPVTEGLIPSTNSVSSNLLVTLTNTSGTKVDGRFAFVVYKP